MHVCLYLLLGKVRTLLEYADGLLSKIMGDGLEWTVMTTQAPEVLNTIQMEMFIFGVLSLRLNTQTQDYLKNADW